MIYALAIIVAVIFLAADQISKYLITQNFALAETMPVLDGVFDFTYIHNKGGAWGMLEGYTWLLLSLTVIAMLMCIMLLIKGKDNKLLFWSICLVLSGGLGNMIDRIFRDGNVVDFIHVQFIEFPIFNIADCAVVIGAGLLILYFIMDFVGTKNGKTQKPLKPETEEKND